MSSITRTAIVGAGGRMGNALLRALDEAAGASLVAAFTAQGSAVTGQDAGTLAGLAPLGVKVADRVQLARGEVDVVIDFSAAGAVATTADACAAAGVALMLGTTGFDADARQRLDLAARHVPVLVAPNTSLALNVLLELVRRGAAALPASYDIEVVESHHRHKVDAPSGTALALGEAAAAGRGEVLPRPPTLTGSAPGPRGGGIGFGVVRGGDVVGEHDVRFLGAGEQLRLMHVATDRAIFARGAVSAALWLAKQPPGTYRMADFLFPDQ